jgi:hypothetical protein
MGEFRSDEVPIDFFEGGVPLRPAYLSRTFSQPTGSGRLWISPGVSCWSFQLKRRVRYQLGQHDPHKKTDTTNRLRRTLRGRLDLGHSSQLLNF